MVLDRAWDGVPAPTGEELERLLGEALDRDLGAGWAHPIVIDPELEVWVFADSTHVDGALGWADQKPDLRSALRERQLWPDGVAKPSDPKAAVEWALRRVGKPRSSSIYREIAQRVTFTRCQDRAFLRLKQLLGQWFPRTNGSLGPS